MKKQPKIIKEQQPKTMRNWRKEYHPTRVGRLRAAIIRGWHQRNYDRNYFNHADFYN